jgi:hypothetical protein
MSILELSKRSLGAWPTEHKSRISLRHHSSRSTARSVARTLTTPSSNTRRRASALTPIIIMDSLAQVEVLVMAIRAVTATTTRRRKAKAKDNLVILQTLCLLLKL